MFKKLTKKIRFFALFLTAILKRQYKMIFLGLLLGVVFYFAAPFALKRLSLPKKTIKIGLVGQYEVGELPDEVLQDISFGLTSVSSKGEALPALAESWQVKDDNKTYVFKLKQEDFFWHDGQKLQPSDINYNFKDVKLTVVGNELIFNFQKPFSPFPVILAKPLFKKGLIGLGPYKVQKIERNGNYVKSIFLVPAWDKSLPKKIYRFYKTEKDLKLGFNLGEVDILENILDIDGIALGKAVKVEKKPLLNAYLAVFFNTTKSPFADKSFRQALAYAIPKEETNRALGPISPLSWAYNPSVKPYTMDLARAKSLLEGQGDLKNLNLKIMTFPQFESVANLVRDSWRQIGIESQVQIVTFIPEDYDVLILARETPPDPDQYVFWHSTQSGNLSNFKSLRIDKLLEDGRTLFDKEERKDNYFDFQRFLVEESPAVFLSHPEVYTVVRN